MKTLLWIFLVGLCAGCSAIPKSTPIPKDYSVQEGDMLFQSLPKSPLVVAIEGVSQSSYSHCGIVVERKGQWYVLEAIGPVTETPLARWIARGRGRKFDAYRLSDNVAPAIPGIIAAAREHQGKGYDIHYRFDNREIYCSELIFIATRQAAGIELGKVQRLGELNWQPYAGFIRSLEGEVPLDRPMITPVSLASASELRKVYP